MEPSMKTANLTGTKNRFFYGWWIIAAGVLIIAFGTGANGFLARSLYSLLGSNASKTGIVLGIYYMVMPISLLAIGPLIDRHGPRKLMLIGILAAGTAIIGLSLIPNLRYMFLGILAIGMSAAFFLPVQTAIANWFMNARCMVFAVVCAASVLGAPMVNLSTEFFAHQSSLQSTLFGLGVAMLVIGIPLAFVIRHKPEPYGYAPDGIAQPVSQTLQPVTRKETHFVEVNYSLRQALKTKAFWLLCIALCLFTESSVLIEMHRPLYLMEKEFHRSAMTGSSELASFLGLIWILSFGFLGDRYSKRHLLAIAIAVQSLSVFILMTKGGIAPLLLHLLVYSFGAGTAPLILAIRADYFGRKAFATISAFMGVFNGILSQGFVFLNQGILRPSKNYETAFLLSILIGLVAAVTILFAIPPELPKHKVSDHP
jgi:sugar phosphate permease